MRKLLTLIMAGGSLMILPFGTVIDGKTIQFKRPGTLVDTQDLNGGLSLVGSGLIAESFGLTTSLVTSDVTLTPNSVRFVMVNISAVKTITGVMFFQSVQGNYTASATNRVGLYSFDGSNLNLVASSADDANLWKSVTNTIKKEAFTVPYNAQPGAYWIGFNYNSSAVVTPPKIGAGVAALSGALALLDLPNSAATYCVSPSMTDLPATIAMSSMSTDVNRPWLALY